MKMNETDTRFCWALYQSLESDKPRVISKMIHTSSSSVITEREDFWLKPVNILSSLKSVGQGIWYLDDKLTIFGWCSSDTYVIHGWFLVFSTGKYPKTFKLYRSGVDFIRSICNYQPVLPAHWSPPLPGWSGRQRAAWRGQPSSAQALTVLRPTQASHRALPNLPNMIYLKLLVLSTVHDMGLVD